MALAAAVVVAAADADPGGAARTAMPIFALTADAFA